MNDSKRHLWPVDPATGEPIPPRAQPGYYPRFQVLSQQAFWDEATRRVVLDRVENVPEIRFFSAAEATLLEAVFNRLLPQDDRDEAHRIPLVPYVDERLFSGKGDGYRYEEMPDDPDVYRLALAAFDAMANELHAKCFVALDVSEQDAILESIHEGRPLGDVERWRLLPARRVFAKLLHDAAATYYSHPFAWDEIGFGGPAYPRGYMRLERGEPEPWESAERRYAWVPPDGKGAPR